MDMYCNFDTQNRLNNGLKTVQNPSVSPITVEAYFTFIILFFVIFFLYILISRRFSYYVILFDNIKIIKKNKNSGDVENGFIVYL